MASESRAGVCYWRLQPQWRCTRLNPGLVLRQTCADMAASVHGGFSPEFHPVLLPHFQELRISRCPFANLPDRGEGRWGEGMTAAKMVMCRWLEPFIVVRIEFLEWTPDNRLRHPRFAAIRSDKDAREVTRE